jgi:thioester reductase-like protein
VEIEQAQATGYARSKLVSERILEAAIASAGARAQIMRIGQVVGDTRHGLWNDSEAWPLVIRSALTLKTLPAFDMVCLFAWSLAVFMFADLVASDVLVVTC